MKPKETEITWAAERMTRDGDVLIELATRLSGGAIPHTDPSLGASSRQSHLEWVNRELALVMQDLSLVLSDLVVLSSETPRE
jgi:hypothetical protein